MIAVFAQVDSLPSAEAWAAVLDGDAQRTPQQRRLHMGRHVVGAFASVAVGEVFGGDRRHRSFEIERDVRVSVFVDRQGCRRVLQQQVQQAGAEGAKFGKLREDFVSNQVKSAGPGRKPDALLAGPEAVQGKGQLTAERIDDFWV